MSKKLALETELADKKKERVGIVARMRMMVDETNQVLVPLSEKKEKLEARIKSLQGADDATLKEMGYKGRKEADDLVRALEDEAKAAKVSIAMAQAGWEVEQESFKGKLSKLDARIREIEADLANFKEPEAAGA